MANRYHSQIAGIVASHATAAAVKRRTAAPPHMPRAKQQDAHQPERGRRHGEHQAEPVHQLIRAPNRAGQTHLISTHEFHELARGVVGRQSGIGLVQPAHAG